MANAQAIEQVLSQAVNATDVPGVVAMAATDRGVIANAARSLAREPRVGGTCQHLLLDRSDEACDRRVLDTDPAVLRSQGDQTFSRLRGGGVRIALATNLPDSNRPWMNGLTA
jgi:hypothetical protein